MKKFAIMSLALMATCVGVFAFSTNIPVTSNLTENVFEKLNVVNICNLKEGEISEIMEGESPQIALEFSAQTVLPISFFMKGDLVNLIENEKKATFIEIKKNFYVRCVEKNNFIFSLDLKEWKPLLEFITGDIYVSVNVEEDETSICIGGEINHR